MILFSKLVGITMPMSERVEEYVTRADRYGPVKPLSKLNQMFFGYFDPINNFL